MSSADKLKYMKMEEEAARIYALNRGMPTFFNTSTGEISRLVVTSPEYEQFKQMIREEVHAALEADLMAAIEEPVDEQEEIAAILAEMSERDFEALVKRVKEMKRE